MFCCVKQSEWPAEECFQIPALFPWSLVVHSEAAADLKADGGKERWGAELQVRAAGAAGHHRNNGLQYRQQVPFQVGLCSSQLWSSHPSSNKLSNILNVNLNLLVPGARLCSSCCRPSPSASSFSTMEAEPAEVRLLSHGQKFNSFLWSHPLIC